MSLLIRDGRIVDITPSAAPLKALYPAATVVDLSSRLVLPGFVNAHYHGESFLLRPVTGRFPYTAWPSLMTLRQSIASLLDQEAPRQIAEMYALAGVAHLLGGTTCVGDFPLPYGAGGLAAALEGLGLSGIRHHVVLQNWEQIETARAWPEGGGGRPCSVALGREDEYTIYGFETRLRAAKDLQCPITAHLGEERSGVETLRRNFKHPPLAVLREYGVLKQGTQIIHGNHLAAGDLTVLRDTHGTVTLCPVSAAAKGTGYPLMARLSSHDVRMCVGTDWGSTDLLGEMKFLRRLAQMAPAVRPFAAIELLRMATINGAHALGMAGQTGSLEIGKRADVVTFSLEDFRIPALDPHSTVEELATVLVDHLDAAHVADVMVEGKFRVRSGAPVQGDAHSLRQRLRALQDQTIGAAPRTPDDGRGPAELPPLIPPHEGSYLSSHHDVEGRPATTRQHGANFEHPPLHQEDPPEKLPAPAKKIKKIFGEDDV